MARKQEPAEDTETYITDVVTKANRLGWDQGRTMQHLIAGLNNQLKPLLMMKNPAHLQEACRVIGTAKEAVKTQAAKLQGAQTTAMAYYQTVMPGQLVFIPINKPNSQTLPLWRPYYIIQIVRIITFFS